MVNDVIYGGQRSVVVGRQQMMYLRDSAIRRLAPELHGVAVQPAEGAVTPLSPPAAAACLEGNPDVRNFVSNWGAANSEK